MNNKERELNRIVDVVIRCCKMTDKESVTRTSLLGGSKRENVVMTRCILVGELIRTGYTITTCADLLGCSPQTARMLLSRGYEYQRTSRAYRLARNETSKLVDENAE